MDNNGRAQLPITNFAFTTTTLKHAILSLHRPIWHVFPVHPALQEHRLVKVRHTPFWHLGVQPAVDIYMPFRIYIYICLFVATYLLQWSNKYKTPVRLRLASKTTEERESVNECLACAKLAHAFLDAALKTEHPQLALPLAPRSLAHCGNWTCGQSNYYNTKTEDASNTVLIIRV